jgi:hypothetical protein
MPKEHFENDFPPRKNFQIGAKRNCGTISKRSTRA